MIEFYKLSVPNQRNMVLSLYIIFLVSRDATLKLQMSSSEATLYLQTLSSEATFSLQMSSVIQIRLAGNAIFSAPNQDRGLIFFCAHSSHIPHK